MACGCNLRKRINREHIKTNKRDVYLDYNATTKPDVKVLAEIDRVNRLYWGNPSAQNSRGVELYNLIKSNLHQCKKILDIENYNSYFDTSSTSIIAKISNLQSFDNIISTTIEHPSLLKNANKTIRVNKHGIIDLEELKNTLKSSNSIIIYSPVNHETGNIQPLKDIYLIAKDSKTPIIFDAVQTISRLELNTWLPYCDGFYYSGHKIHSVQGAAVLFIKKDIIDFNLNEASLPFSLYNGTINSSGVIGLLNATILLQSNFNEYITNLRILHSEALTILQKIKQIQIESEPNSAPGIINVTLSEIENIEEVLLFLNREGIQTGRLSACSGDINSESNVLKMMGRDKIKSKSSLRLSFGKDSKRDDFFRVSSSIKKYYNGI